MPVVATDLLDPTGPITPAMFPDDDPTGGVVNLTARLAAYIARAYAQDVVVALTSTTDQDTAARAYALYLTFDTVAARLAATPSSATLQGLGSVAIGSSQVKYYEERARLALAEFTGFTATVTDTRLHPVSASVKTAVAW